MSVAPELERKARARSKGKCERCKAGAGNQMALLKDGRWARWSYAAGYWVDGAGHKLSAWEVEGRREEVIRLDVVLAGAHAHVMIAGRVVALCQSCAQKATIRPAAPRPVEGDLFQ